MSGPIPPKAGTPRDSAEACRDRAAADLVESGTMMTANQRVRLETSAASWTARAQMLQRVEDSVERRVQASQSEPGPDATDSAALAPEADATDSEVRR